MVPGHRSERRLECPSFAGPFGPDRGGLLEGSELFHFEVALHTGLEVVFLAPGFAGNDETGEQVLAFGKVENDFA